MIETNLREIIDAQETLKMISKMKLKARSAYKLARILREADKELKTEQEAHKELIDKYGQRDENGDLKQTEEGNFLIEEENLNEYFKEYKELLDTLVTLNCDFIDLADIEEATLTPSQMNSIMVFIHE